MSFRSAVSSVVTHLITPGISTARHAAHGTNRITRTMSFIFASPSTPALSHHCILPQEHVLPFPRLALATGSLEPHRKRTVVPVLAWLPVTYQTLVVSCRAHCAITQSAGFLRSLFQSDTTACGVFAHDLPVWPYPKIVIHNSTNIISLPYNVLEDSSILIVTITLKHSAYLIGGEEICPRVAL